MYNDPHKQVKRQNTSEVYTCNHHKTKKINMYIKERRRIQPDTLQLVHSSLCGSFTYQIYAELIIRS